MILKVILCVLAVLAVVTSEMNNLINFSIDDWWVREYAARHLEKIIGTGEIFLLVLIGTVSLIAIATLSIILRRNRIDRGGIEAYWRDYKFSTIVLLGSLVYFAVSIAYGDSVSGSLNFTTSMSLFALFIAIYSLESSTLKFKDIQTDYWNMRGIDHRDKKEYYTAFQAFDNGIRLDPKSIKCLVNKANAKCVMGERFHDTSLLNDALNIINHALQLGPKYSPAILTHETLEETPIQETREGKAKQEYANALKSKCDILIHLVDLQEENEKKESLAIALECIENAICRYPDNNAQLPGAYTTKGTVLSKLKKYDGAIKACEKAIRLEPREPIAWAIKGSILAAKGNHEAAIKDFDKAIELKPGSSDFWYSKGQSLKKMSRRAGPSIRKQEHLLMAVHAYDKSIEFNQLNSNAWNQKGKALSDLGRHYHSEGLKSLNSYAMDINIYSNAGLFWLEKSNALFRQANCCFKKALKSYDRAIDINPNDGMFWFNKGLAFGIQGKYDEAIEAYDKAIRQDPEYGDAWHHKGNALFNLGKYDMAIESYDKAILFNPKNASTWHNKGASFDVQGKISEASESYDKARELGWTG